MVCISYSYSSSYITQLVLAGFEFLASPQWRHKGELGWIILIKWLSIVRYIPIDGKMITYWILDLSCTGLDQSGYRSCDAWWMGYVLTLLFQLRRTRSYVIYDHLETCYLLRRWIDSVGRVVCSFTRLLKIIVFFLLSVFNL